MSELVFRYRPIGGGRNEVVDLAKGIGIILVFIGHTTAEGSILRNFIYTFHMPLFFALSGYLMDIEKYDLHRFVISRTKTILLPLFMYSFIAIPFSVQIGSSPSYALPFGYWFLPVLFVSEILSFILLKRSYCIGLCIVVLSVISHALFVCECPNWYSILVVPLATAFVMFGNFTNRYVLRFTKISTAILICTIIFVSITLFSIYGSSFNDLQADRITDWPMGLVFACAGILLTIVSCMILSRYGNKCLKYTLVWCGRNSLAIYLIHFMIIVAFTRSKELFDNHILYMLIKLLGSVVCTGILTLIITKKLSWTLGKF